MDDRGVKRQPHISVAGFGAVDAISREHPRWSSEPVQFAASLFLGRTNQGALFISGLGCSPEPATAMLSGVIHELVAHLANPECTGPRCDSIPERSPVSSRLSFAEAEYRLAIEGDPRLMEARLRLGRVLFLRNQRKPARQELEAVTKDSTDARLLYLGHLFLGGLDVFENDLPRARREHRPRSGRPSIPRTRPQLRRADVGARVARARGDRRPRDAAEDARQRSVARLPERRCRS